MLEHEIKWKEITRSLWRSVDWRFMISAQYLDGHTTFVLYDWEKKLHKTRIIDARATLANQPMATYHPDKESALDAAEIAAKVRL